jgi:hypothetical protein
MPWSLDGAKCSRGLGIWDEPKSNSWQRPIGGSVITGAQGACASEPTGEYLASGMNEQAILADFPELRREHIQVVLGFAAERERRLSALPAVS